jgi:PAT family beta-lactamase induction signal transducer AmpG
MTTRSDTAAAPAAPAHPGWRDVLRSLRQPKVAIMLGLGLACGLPFVMVGNTMGMWLREGGVELATIGFLSWVGLAYSMKFLWAPIVDRVHVPLLGRWLGHRRGWMALAQLAVASGLVGMALISPHGGLVAFGALALVAAFASATQDIVVDAWRIESSTSEHDLALLSAAYQLGYRAALLLTDAWLLVVAANYGWSLSYQLVAALMGVGLVAVWFAREPAVPRATEAILTPSGIFDAVIGPFLRFFEEHGRWALLMLVAISLYRLPDFFMGPMANPFYVDIGIATDVVGKVRGSFGLVASILGISAAGLFAVRFGFTKTLLLGAILGPGSNAAFAYMAWHGADPAVFATAMVIDNFSAGFAGVALVGYMSSLTSLGYTATQYALLSSFYALPGKFLKGLSGVCVEYFQALSGSAMGGYAWFFLATALLGIPVFLLCLWLGRRAPQRYGAAA